MARFPEQPSIAVGRGDAVARIGIHRSVTFRRAIVAARSQPDAFRVHFVSSAEPDPVLKPFMAFQLPELRGRPAGASPFSARPRSRSPVEELAEAELLLRRKRR